MELVCVQRLLLLLFFLVCCLKDSLGTGKLSLKLLTYENPSKKLLDGSCCDTGCQPCDNYFKLCLSSKRPSSIPCSIGSFWTEEAGDDSFTFSNTIYESMPEYVEKSNPLEFSFVSWNDTYNLKVDVYDNDHGVDSHNHPYNGLVDLLSVNLTSKASRSKADANKQSITLLGKPRGSQSGPKLAVEISVYCSANFLIPSCSEYCVDTDDVSGHYKCNYINGSRDCLSGWYGTQCNLKKPSCVPRNDTFGHYNCHENGTKRCLPGWITPEGNCTEAEHSVKKPNSQSHISTVASPSGSLGSIARSSSWRMTSASATSTTPLKLARNLVLTTKLARSSKYVAFASTESLIEGSEFSKTISSELLVHKSTYVAENLSSYTRLRQDSTTSSNDASIITFSSFPEELSDATTSSRINSNITEFTTLIEPTESKDNRPLTTVPTVATAPQGQQNNHFWLISLVIPVAIAVAAVVYLYRSKHCKRVSRIYPHNIHTNSHNMKQVINVKPALATTTTAATTTFVNEQQQGI